MTELSTWWREAGLPPAAGRVLEHLVSHPQSTTGEIGDRLGLSRRAVGRALTALEEEMLVVPVGRRPTRWTASPPRAALQALVERRRARLAGIEPLAERLQEAYSIHLDRRFASDQFEVLDTAERVSARYDQLIRSARSEILYVVMPPYVSPPEDLDDRLSAQAQAAARGVRFRAVYDAATFDDDISVQSARAGLRFGGGVRLTTGLPMKVVLFDDQAAIMTIAPDDPAHGSLLIYSPPLLRVLRALFEELWSHGVDWSDIEDPAPAVADERGIDPRWGQVLRLMAAGMKDDAIARVLGVSRRTVQKVVSDVGAHLGAQTRFQIALRAQALGWLDNPPEETAAREPRRSTG